MADEREETPQPDAAIPTNEAIEGSWEETETRIREALNKTSVCGGDILNQYQYLTATFPDYCIVSCHGTGLAYKVPYSVADGVVTLDVEGKTPVEISETFKELTPEQAEARRKKAPRWYRERGYYDEERTEPATLEELLAMNEELTPERPVSLNESTSRIIYNESDEGGKKVIKIWVDKAQQGDKLNENRRYYPSALLEVQAKRCDALAKQGKLLMEGYHRVEGGKNVRRLTETVAMIGGVKYNKADHTISLEDIVFVETVDGNNMKALARAGVALGVSQRASGTATQRTWNEDQKPYEHIETLLIEGWDFVDPTNTGVAGAEVSVLLEDRSDKDNREMPEEKDPKETPPANNNPGEVTPPTTAPVFNEESARRLIDSTIDERTKPLNDKIGELETSNRVLTEERDRALRLNENRAWINETLGSEPYQRFNETQRTKMLQHLDLSQPREAVEAQLKGQTALLDEMLSENALQAMGYHKTNSPGIVVVVNEEHPVLQKMRPLNEAVQKQLYGENDGFYAKKGSRDKETKMFLEQFDAKYGHLMLNEENQVAAHIPQAIALSRIIIEQALPILRALDLVESFTMGAITEQIYIEKWGAPLDAELTQMMVGENVAAPLAGLRLTPYNIYASARKIRTAITPELLVMAKGVAGGYDVRARTLAGMAKDYARRTDRYIFRLLVAAADTQDYRVVTTNETLTQVGSTNTWQSANRAWIRWEHFKKYNAETNQPTTIIAVAGTQTGSLLQQVVVVDSAGSPATLVRGYLQADGTITVNEDGSGGAADYYVNWADGSITVKAGHSFTEPFKAKYSYTLNTKYWPLTPPSGTLGAHLSTLGMYVGNMKARMRTRFNYDPVRQATSVTMSDIITNSEKFQFNTGNPGNQLRDDNSIGRFAGMPLWDSTQMVDDKYLIMADQVAWYGILEPYKLSPTLVNTETGEESVLAQEWAANDVPTRERITTITIGS